MEKPEKINENLYVPRKCSYTNRILTSKDHSSVQLPIGTIEDTISYNGNFEIFSLCGNLRKQGRADEALNILIEKTDSITYLLFKKKKGKKSLKN